MHAKSQVEQCIVPTRRRNCPATDQQRADNCICTGIEGRPCLRLARAAAQIGSPGCERTPTADGSQRAAARACSVDLQWTGVRTYSLAMIWFNLSCCTGEAICADTKQPYRIEPTSILSVAAVVAEAARCGVLQSAPTLTNWWRHIGIQYTK